MYGAFSFMEGFILHNIYCFKLCDEIPFGTCMHGSNSQHSRLHPSAWILFELVSNLDVQWCLYPA